MDESNVQSSKPKRIIRVVRPSTETKLFTGLSSSKKPETLTPQGLSDTVQPLASNSERVITPSVNTDQQLKTSESTGKIKSSLPAQTLTLTPAQSLLRRKMDEKSKLSEKKSTFTQKTLEKQEPKISLTSTKEDRYDQSTPNVPSTIRRLPPPPISSAIASKTVRSTKEDRYDQSNPTVPSSSRRLPPPPISSALTTEQQTAEKNRQQTLEQSSTNPIDSKIIDSSVKESNQISKPLSQTGFYVSGRKESDLKNQELNPEAREFIPKSLKEPILSKRESNKKSTKKNKISQKQIEIANRRAEEERKIRSEEIMLHNFPKKTIIRPTNKFNELFNVKPTNISESISKQFLEIDKTLSSKLDKIKLTKFEDCSKSKCIDWQNSTYLNSLLNKNQKKINFKDNNIIITVKDESSTKNIQIPKYEELNSYLHKLNKLFNRLYIQDETCSEVNKIDLMLEKIYTALHTILSKQTNNMNKNDINNQITTELYLLRKFYYDQKKMNEWNETSKRYLDEQKKHISKESSSVIIEYPVAFINDNFYVILKNPEIS